MNRSAVCLSAALLIGLIATGCDNAKSPRTVTKDVNSAADSADAKTAKVEQKAEQEVAHAQGDVSKEQTEEQHVAAVQGEDVAKTEAEGQRNIELAKCEAFSGDQQRACKDRADAAYDVAIAQAKQNRANSDPRR